jgi:hypothetical protein
MKRASWWLIGCAWLLGCGNSPQAVDVPGEATSAAAQASAIEGLTSVKAATSLFVLEDPTLDLTRSAGQNADSIAQQLQSLSCANFKLTHAAGMVTVSADFGAGCTTAKGTFAGAATATVSKQAGSLSVAFMFTNLVVNGLVLNGTCTLATSDGTTFTVDAEVSAGSMHLTFMGTAALDAQASGVTLDGSGLTEGVSYTAAGVHHAFQSCYADAGTFTITHLTTSKSGTTFTVVDIVTFSATTPATGQVTVTVNGVSAPAMLPAYSGCPHG